MGLSSKEVIGADNTLNCWSQAVVLGDISKPVAAAEALELPALMKCPRCDSTNTKFCYYNNYSRMQPRHLCRACKRHWTAGGTLRNVPVGGARRKNKRARTTDNNNTKTTSDGGPTGQQQLPFNLDYDEISINIFPAPVDVLSRLLSPVDSLYGADGGTLSISSHLNKSIQELPELSLSYWNCWDGGLTELGIQDLDTEVIMH